MGVEGAHSSVSGSSPRGRGKHHRRPHRRGGERLIPAWAGKTSGPRTSCVSTRGSSPRGRGKRRLPAPVRRRPGLIPAWAGKTSGRRDRREYHAAHPRVGGENSDPAYGRALSMGSSPRGRGKLQATPQADNVPGLIPAWAGKTSARTCPSPRPRAHPRVGGENVVFPLLCVAALGSSPRGRGKLDKVRGHQGHGGLIPAWAGKTARRGRGYP